MKSSFKAVIAALLAFTTLAATAEPAKSQKHADHALKMRKAVYSLLGSNMGPLGGMAKGKIPMNVQVLEKNAQRINQLSLMISDYLKTDTSKFTLKTEALDNIWTDGDKFSQRIEALTKASDALYNVANSGDETAIRKAIGRVGKTCGGCHDDFKAE
jgi:cytochrome c556